MQKTIKVFIEPPRYVYKGRVLFVKGVQVNLGSVNWAVWFEGVNKVMVKMILSGSIFPSYNSQLDAQEALDNFAKKEKLTRCYKLKKVEK